MVDYDSDSSLDDSPSGTETNVVLGYAADKPDEGAVSHLGGHPIWLDPNNMPPAELGKCKVCNDYMSLLLQLNGDLPSHFPDNERRLHLFCCRKKTCSRKIGSVRAFREVKGYPSEKTGRMKTRHEEEPKDNKPTHDLGATLFGVSASNSARPNPNPFSTSSQSQPANPFSCLPPTASLAAKSPQRPMEDLEPPTETFAQKLRISSPTDATSLQEPLTEPWPPQSAFPPPYPTYDLESEGELLYPASPSPFDAGPSRVQYDEAEETISGGAEKDLFESSLDKSFLRFSDRLSHNPEQVLRYEFGGMPLLYSGTDAVAGRFVAPHGSKRPVAGIPRCGNCGSERLFEYQLVPGAIDILEGDEMIDLEHGMEWGTIIVGTCAKDCAVVGRVVFREEWVGVQWEERMGQK